MKSECRVDISNEKGATELRGAMSVQCTPGLENSVARKSKKLYMQDGVSISYGSSITTGKAQEFFLSAHDVELIKGKKVGIVDDVISTGESLKGLEALVQKAGGIVTKKLFVLAEGAAKDRPDVNYLATIPLL